MRVSSGGRVGTCGEPSGARLALAHSHLSGLLHVSETPDLGACTARL